MQRTITIVVCYDVIAWYNPVVHELREKIIRWAAVQEVQEELAGCTNENPFTYVVLDVPFPPPHEERLRYEEEVGPMDREPIIPATTRSKSLWIPSQPSIG